MTLITNASVSTSAAAAFNPNMDLVVGSPNGGSDVLTVKCKLQRGAAGKSSTIASLAGPYGICGNIIVSAKGNYVLGLNLGGFTYAKGALKLQNGITQPKGHSELSALPLRTFPEGKLERVGSVSAQAQSLAAMLMVSDPADFLKKIAVTPGTPQADAIVVALKGQHPDQAENIEAAYAELKGGNLSRNLLFPQDWDDVVLPLTGELYSRIWMEIPAEVAAHISELADNVEDTEDGKAGAWNSSITFQFLWGQATLADPQVKGTKRSGQDVTPYTLNGNNIMERSFKLPLLSVSIKKEAYNPVNPFQAVPQQYMAGVADKAYQVKTEDKGRDMSDIVERMQLNQALLQQFGSVAGGKKKVQKTMNAIVAKAAQGKDVSEEVQVVKVLVKDPDATHYTEGRLEDLESKIEEAANQASEIEEDAPAAAEEEVEVIVPTSLEDLMASLG